MLVAVHRGERHTATYVADGDMLVAGNPDPEPTVRHALAKRPPPPDGPPLNRGQGR
jgi:hypothetical protein